MSGVAVAIHLLRRGGPGLELVVVERDGQRALGRGIAYGVESRVFRLNVPASKMSLDPEHPEDFVTWAQLTERATPTAFLPRTVYGAYVEERFAEAVRESRASLRVVRGRAVSVDDEGVTLEDGTRLLADDVVLATGLSPAATDVDRDRHREVNAWDERALATLPRAGRLLILGAGLTALDALAFLDAHGFTGHVTVVSRRALLPRPHLSPLRPASPLSAQPMTRLPEGLRPLIAWVRAVVRETEARGEPWQLAIDSVRPHIPALWRRLSPGDRARFVRSVRPYWDVLRHRAPVDALALVDAWRNAGRLELLAGSMVRCTSTGGALDIELRLAGGTRARGTYDALVRCTGPALVRGDADDPLVRSLIASGRAMEDPAGLGLVTDDDGRVVPPDGATAPRIFALGALRRASAWDTTSVPEISVQALALARLML